MFSESKEIPGKLWGTWGKANVKKDILAVDPEQIVAETLSLGAEQSTVGTSDLGTVQAASDISDLGTAKVAVDVDPEEFFKIRQLLTDEQQLYVYKALNLQKAYALLKSGVVKNMRFYGNIEKIVTENGGRRYSGDKGDAFTELLYMLYPSPAGDLNTNTNFRGRDSFAMYGGMSPELAAKFFAILNDCRNNKVEIPEEITSFTFKKDVGKESFHYCVNSELKRVLTWLKDKGLLTDKDIEDVIKEAEKHEKSLNELDISRLKTKFDYIKKACNCKKDVAAYFKEEEERLKRKLGNENTNLGIIKELEEALKKELTEEDLKDDTLVRDKLKKQKEVYKGILKELNSKAESIENSEISKKAKFLIRFINVLKEAVKLEVTDGSSYPEYLTERILMSYMCQTLNSSEDVRELYQKIAEQLSQNETNKIPNPEEKKAAIAEKIVAEKEEIDRLNDIINTAKIQEMSPYKSATQSNGTTYKIGLLDSDGNVQIQADTFADCADIAARHVINLLTFANEQNWDLILKDANMEDLNTKLKEVVDAIENKNSVKFYDLKTRLQMFFLYQRGFIEGIDNEEDIEYRSKNGADDVTPLARTLWEYVICNMNEENLAKGQDKDEGFYSIAYAYGKNHELDTGYTNMLKLMWNMAKALNLQSGRLDSAKNEIDALSSLKEYDETAFKKALSSTFALFNASDGIEFTLSDCKYEEGKVTGNVNVTVDITKGDQRLKFTIDHYTVHGEITHNPIESNFYKYAEKCCKFDEPALTRLKKLEGKSDWELTEEDRVLLGAINSSLNNNFEKLLLRSFINDSSDRERITPPAGFYGAFSKVELKSDDIFKNTDLYKKYKALSAFKALQDEENNVTRVNQVLDIDIMKVAKKIVVRQIIKDEGKPKGKYLSDIIYVKYLQNHEDKKEDYPNINDMICFYKFGEIEETYFTNERGEKQKNMNFDIIKTSGENEVYLLIKSIPENGELIIPSTIHDKDGKEYKVRRFDKYSNVAFETLKTIKFTGNFENLEIWSYFFHDFKNLQTIEINGNVKKLTILESTFYCHQTLREFIIKGDIGDLTLMEDAFCSCKVLGNLIIQGNVENLNLGSKIVSDSSKAKIFLPEDLKNKVPANFEEKNKVIFYNITGDGTLHLKVNEAVGEISLDKETQETLGENFKNLRAMGLEGNAVEIIFDDGLEGEFLEVKDETRLHYENKKV